MLVLTQVVEVTVTLLLDVLLVKVLMVIIMFSLVIAQDVQVAVAMLLVTIL